MPASWRDQYQFKGYLYLLPPTTVFAAQVNQATITYPLAQITYDSVTTGAYTDIQPDMTILFGTEAGLDDLGRGRVRKAPTSSILYIGWSSQGIRDGECNLANDAFITVLDDFRAWAKIPRLVNLQEQYKDFDLAYTEGTDIPPIANGGPWVMKVVDSNGIITVNFAGTGTVTDPGAAITTHAWDFGDGTPASAATASVSGVTFPYGVRWVHYTVTDDNAKTHTHHILVAAVSEDYRAEVSYSGATITATSEFGVGWASRAFDNNTGTWWTTEVGTTEATLKIQFPSAQTIVQYDVDVTNLSPVAPTAWTFEGSNNDSDYTVLDTQTGQTWFAPNERTYTITEPGSYLYYRIVITGSTDANQVGITELNLDASSSNVITGFEILDDTLSREGNTFRVRIHDDIPTGTYPDGTAFMYMELEWFNGVLGSLAGPADREHMKRVGWHATDTALIEGTERGIRTNTELEFHDIGQRMRAIPAFSSIVGRIGTSTAWYLLPSAHTDRYVHYLLHWHSTVLNVAPFTWSGTEGTYALPWFATTATNLWEQVQWRTRSIAHELTVSRQGELKMLPDPMLQDSGDRTATIITDIDPQDWTSISYTHQRPPRVHWLWSNAVVASTLYISQTGLNVTSVFSVAPGEAPGQGAVDQQQGEQMVPATTPQTYLNAREGHRYAARLNPFETYFEIQLVHDGDVGIDPASMTWVRLTIDATTAAQRGLTFTDERFLPYQVTTTYNHETNVKTVTVSAEREVTGTPAATHIPATATTVPVTPNPDDWPIIYQEEPTYDLHRGAKNIAAFDSASKLHVSTDFNIPEASGGPTWATTDLTGLTPALSGTFLRMVGDPFSPLYLGTGTAVNGWILTSTKIFKIADIFGSPTLTDQHTLATAGANYGFIATGIGVQNWVVAVVNYVGGTGTKAVYTTDGSTWTESTITSFYATGATFGQPHCPPLFVSSSQAGLVYAGAFTSTSGTPPGALYKSTNYGSTWAAATDITVAFDNYNGGALNIPWHDNAGQKLAYWGAWDVTTDSPSLWRTEADGTTTTNITPSAGDFGIFSGFWQLSVCPTNRQRVAIAGWDSVSPGPNDVFAIFVSQDAGDSWTQVTSNRTASTGHHGVAIAGDDPDVIYAWGYGETLDYSQDFGQTWEDKTTNLAGSDSIVNVIGG